MTVELARSAEVLEPGQRTPREIEDAQIGQVVQAHEAVLRAGVDFIAAAAKAGRILLELKSQREPGNWRAWIDENLPFKYATAHLYMRCATHEATIRDQGWSHLRQVKEGLGALVEPDHKGKGATGRTKPEWMKSLARELHQDGMRVAHIAREIGVNPSTVKSWVDPEYGARSRERCAAINKRRVAAERALRERERNAAIKRAVRKAGAADKELYAMAERMQDVMGQAQREATDSEKRRHYARAGEHYRRMRDEIVRALGVL